MAYGSFALSMSLVLYMQVLYMYENLARLAVIIYGGMIVVKELV